MLRSRRKALGLTLERLSSEAGIATGFLSQIERDQASPSVASLIRLCEVLGIPVGSLFASSQSQLVRAQAREKMTFGGTEIRYEHLTSRTAAMMSAVHSVLQPGGTSGDEQHGLDADEQFIFVLQGELMVEIEAERFHLQVGDALTHDPRRRHRYYNPSATDVCICICIITPYPRS